jgi:hypothetical protein
MDREFTSKKRITDTHGWCSVRPMIYTILQNIKQCFLISHDRINFESDTIKRSYKLKQSIQIFSLDGEHYGIEYVYRFVYVISF